MLGSLLCGDNGSKQAHAGFIMEEAMPPVREEEIKRCMCFLSVLVESLVRGVVSVCPSAAVCFRALLLTCFAGCQGRVLDGSHNRKATHTLRPLPAGPS